ncbi:hypothetical protein J6590_063035 [Homalodisca vitripennis]|nr:hypothetical protein J6590_063035 [Homalodisca vitripennis]
MEQVLLVIICRPAAGNSCKFFGKSFKASVHYLSDRLSYVDPLLRMPQSRGVVCRSRRTHKCCASTAAHVHELLGHQSTLMWPPQASVHYLSDRLSFMDALLRVPPPRLAPISVTVQLLWV